MRHQNGARYLLECAIGALLTGFAWRVRGTGGWGAAWGLMTVGALLTLYLTAARGKKGGPDLPLTALTAFSFMFTAPAWGTLLEQITGVMTVEFADGPRDLFFSPVVGVVWMLLMGFGLAAVFGVTLGRSFGGVQWRLRDDLFVIAVFLIAVYGCKAGPAHLFVRWLQPQAAGAFGQGLAEAGIQKSVYGAYMAHFNAESWAKTIAGGRHYYACVSAVSAAVGSAAAILSVRFFVKDRFAARIGLTVCAAFALSITAADLFFWFGSGGYHKAQGLSLPAGWAAWSLWEYFTGFLAGGAITAVVLRAAPEGEPRRTLLEKLPKKPCAALSWPLCWVALIGVNVVRPLLRRLRGSPAQIPVCAAAGLAVLAVSFLLYKKCGPGFEKIPSARLAPALCAALVLYITAVYMFFPFAEGAARSITELHNILVAVSAAAVIACCAVLYRRAARI